MMFVFFLYTCLFSIVQRLLKEHCVTWDRENVCQTNHNSICSTSKYNGRLRRHWSPMTSCKHSFIMTENRRRSAQVHWMVVTCIIFHFQWRCDYIHSLTACSVILSYCTASNVHPALCVCLFDYTSCFLESAAIPQAFSCSLSSLLSLYFLSGNCCQPRFTKCVQPFLQNVFLSFTLPFQCLISYLCWWHHIAVKTRQEQLLTVPLYRRNYTRCLDLAFSLCSLWHTARYWCHCQTLCSCVARWST